MKKSAETRRALRFFSERRILVHFVDLTERSMSAGELQRFVEQFGIDALIDRNSKRFEQLGLRHAQGSPARWMERLVDEPLLLVLPLVRRLGQPAALTVGSAEDTWKAWMMK